MPYTQSILVTGASSGVGQHCTTALAAARPDILLIVASRTPPVVEFPSNVIYKELDLLSRDNIRDLVSTWEYPPLSALVCNAGMAGAAGAPTFTPEGFERVFSANHLGHALLFFLLNERHLLTDDCNIIFVTSGTHKWEGKGHKPAWIDTESVAKSTDPRLNVGMLRYPTSKLANAMFSNVLAKKAEAAGKKWSVLAFDPGFAPGSGLSRNAPLPFKLLVGYILPNFVWFMRAIGVQGVYYLSMSGKGLADLALSHANNNGKYFQVYTEDTTSPDSHDPVKQEDLWEWTINELGKTPDEKRAFRTL